MRRRGIRRGNEDEFFDEQGDPDQARLLRDLAADAEIHLASPNRLMGTKFFDQPKQHSRQFSARPQQQIMG
jgi:hypothetical protein